MRYVAFPSSHLQQRREHSKTFLWKLGTGLILACMTACGGEKSKMLQAIRESPSKSSASMNCNGEVLEKIQILTVQSRGESRFLGTAIEAPAQVDFAELSKRAEQGEQLDDIPQKSRAVQVLDKLSKAGWLGPQELMNNGRTSFGKIKQTAVYEIKDQAKIQRYMQSDGGGYRLYFCFTKRAPTKIKEFAKLDGNEYKARYEYRIELEDGLDPELVEELGLVVPQQTEEATVYLEKTDKGFRVQGDW